MSEPKSQLQGEAPAYGAPQSHEQQAPEEPARLGPLQRLGGTLFSPGETFEDVNRKPTFIVPIIIAMVVAVASTTFFEWRVKPDWDQIMRTQVKKRVEKSGQSLTPDQIETQVNVGKTIAKFIPLIAIVATPIVYVILAGIYALGMMFIQAKTTFKKVLSVVAWTSAATGIVGAIVRVAVLMVRDPSELRTLDPSQFDSIAPTNVGAFLASDAAVALRALATSIDVFTLWGLILLSIGFAAIAGSKKITTSKAGTIVFGFWAIWVVVKVAWAALFG